jgi:hypothetical protein
LLKPTETMLQRGPGIITKVSQAIVRFLQTFDSDYD